jgi:hypothetical protein
MTDSDKIILDNLERETVALLERATFSIRDEDHAHAERRLNAVIDSVTEWNGLGEAGVFRRFTKPRAWLSRR